MHPNSLLRLPLNTTRNYSQQQSFGWNNVQQKSNLQSWTNPPPASSNGYFARSSNEMNYQPKGTSQQNYNERKTNYSYHPFNSPNENSIAARLPLKLGPPKRLLGSGGNFAPMKQGFNARPHFQRNNLQENRTPTGAGYYHKSKYNDNPNLRNKYWHSKDSGRDRNLKMPEVVERQAKRRKTLAELRSKKVNWTLSEAQRAFDVEKEWHKQRDTTLIIKFPDVEVNRDIVMNYHPMIEHVHFKNPSCQRSCFIKLAADCNVNDAIKELNKQKFGDGYLKVLRRIDNEGERQFGPADIDPLTLYVGNLSQQVRTEEIRNLFPNSKRVDIGRPMKTKQSKYAFIVFHSIDDSIEAYQRTVDTVLHERSLKIRFRRLAGSDSLPGYTKDGHIVNDKIQIKRNVENDADETEKGKSEIELEQLSKEQEKSDQDIDSDWCEYKEDNENDDEDDDDYGDYDEDEKVVLLNRFDETEFQPTSEDEKKIKLEPDYDDDDDDDLREDDKIQLHKELNLTKPIEFGTNDSNTANVAQNKKNENNETRASNAEENVANKLNTGDRQQEEINQPNRDCASTTVLNSIVETNVRPNNDDNRQAGSNQTIISKQSSVIEANNLISTDKDLSKTVTVENDYMPKMVIKNEPMDSPITDTEDYGFSRGLITYGNEELDDDYNLLPIKKEEECDFLKSDED